ncbi:dihydroorotase [Nitrosomonas ureae]|uniref:Dihydroorotase n=1 Tax=Nitrosomonas ureae TaxID=44577 RepID=A0A0S3AF56_9PROT|nr:dihydroorotase [Nitrosomonas ureae]ALQ49801.1 dihydroorotase [Nitrosomonas ureae]SDT84592.1 dihydroorotase [Nitrosomonas ureae]SEQ17865.1 dihydroorotase [Nitrosomonas ureae]
MTSITIIRPDDWHLHLRDGEQLSFVLPHTAKQFARAIIMPNLKPPIVTTDMALSYRARILAALPEPLHGAFDPLMTLYLTDNTVPSEIIRATESKAIQGVKLYPAGATTNSDAGVTNITKCYATLEAMEQNNLPLLVHGEVTDANVDVFDREKIFIDRMLAPLTRRFPNLRIIFEHITTNDAVMFVKEASKFISATITAHHLLLNRNAIFQGGIRPHHFCLPVLKREIHRQALLNAATSGNPKFFLGTDSAPHSQSNKENSCGCAGIYTAHAAIELYATAFEQAGALDKLEAFASFYGADFYQLPRNTSHITLKKEYWTVPEQFEFTNEKLIPLYAGENLTWKMS